MNTKIGGKYEKQKCFDTTYITSSGRYFIAKNDVTITENVFEEREGDGEIVYINGCYNVSVINNIYSERVQAFFDKGNYQKIADIYNCEKGYY